MYAGSFFNNYETIKLPLQSPNFDNIIILGIIIVCICIFPGKKTDKKSGLLNRIQTEQLRGIAILLVIIGHFWIHVSEVPAAAVFSYEGVTMFFMLSGFGLVMSARKHTAGIMTFLERRLKRIMAPYWMSTLVILVLDFLFLGRIYSWKDLAATFMGININPATKHIDYVRWYISFLLVWYIVFIFTYHRRENSRSLAVMMGFAAVIYFSNYYILKFGWYNIFAFPIGCAIGYYFDNVQEVFRKYFKCISTLSVLLLLYVIVYKIYISGFLESNMPYIFLKLLNELSNIIFCFAIMALVAVFEKSNYQSAFLLFCGRISYGLFLVHGAFLIKYNLFIWRGSLMPIPASFCMCLFFIIILSYFFQKIIDSVYSRIL